jgi:hypothetical protein
MTGKLTCINDSWDNSCLAFKSTAANVLSGADRMRLCSDENEQ